MLTNIYLAPHPSSTHKVIYLKKKTNTVHVKGSIEDPAGPVNTVPFSEAMYNALPLFDQGHTHLIEVPAHA